MDEPRKIAAQGETVMKKDELDKKLIAARPEGYAANERFTDNVMKKLRSSEIMSSSIRSMDVTKKETFMTKLKHMPAFAIIAIIITSLLIISGGTYAVYKFLWPKPEVHISEPTTSVSGRKEVVVSLAKCGKSDLVSRYELKKNAPITIDDVPMVVKAHCELDAIGTWASKTFPHSERGPGYRTETREAYDDISLSTSMATNIKSKDQSSITFTGLTKYNLKDTTFEVTAKTRFIVDGHDAQASDISPNDPVIYITSDTSRMTPSSDCNEKRCHIDSTPPVKTLVAVVKLSLPLKYYDQLAWQSLAERRPCPGNKADSCLTGYIGGIDIYQGNATAKIGERIMKEIQGVVTQLNGPSLTIRSSSGALFTVTTPLDAVAQYNANKASRYYNNQTVKVGSNLAVTYVEPEDQHTKSIPPSQIIFVQLQIELIGKSDPINSY